MATKRINLQMRQTINSFIGQHIKEEFGVDLFNIYAIEDCECEICKAQDVFGGKDYIVVARYKEIPIMVSYAVRYQPTYDYETFTIRETTTKGTKTEVNKRVASALLDTDYSTYTLQIYQTHCGVALSKDINKYLVEFEDETRDMTNTDGSDFKIIDWDKYKAKGLYFKRYEVTNRQTPAL